MLGDTVAVEKATVTSTVTSTSASTARVGRQFCWFYFFVVTFGGFRMLSEFDLSQNYLDYASISIDKNENEKDLPVVQHHQPPQPPNATSTASTAVGAASKTKSKTTIAYAVTITKFRSGKNMPATTLYDRAAILHQSIQLAMRQSKYDYHLYAFVHPEAIQVQPQLEQLGYQVQIRETPFHLSQVQNEDLIDKQTNGGCCGEKEYLKLYSYLLFDYPVVVHVDMDYLVLKPMEDVFDLMIDSDSDSDSNYNRSKFQSSSMWTDMQSYNGSIDFVFTRDYNLVTPPSRQPHQIGVQGGFLVVRPSQEDFDRYVDTILKGGNFVKGSGWGGKELKFGGYYGDATIQGLASYYYGHLQPNRAIELNRCYYNTIVDDPMYRNEKENVTRCRTLEEECQDCRQTKLQEIYSAHLTGPCGRPERCRLNHDVGLCRRLMKEWHKIRTSLEQEWTQKYPNYDPGLLRAGNETDDRTAKMIETSGGHCGPNYSPMVFPEVTSNDLIVSE